MKSDKQKRSDRLENMIRSSTDNIINFIHETHDNFGKTKESLSKIISDMNTENETFQNSFEEKMFHLNQLEESIISKFDDENRVNNF